VGRLACAISITPRLCAQSRERTFSQPRVEKPSGMSQPVTVTDVERNAFTTFEFSLEEMIMWHGAMISYKDAWIEGWKKKNPGMPVSGFLSSIAFNEATMRAKIALAKKSLAETRRVVTELKSLRGVAERDFAVRVPGWPYKATEPPYAFDEPMPPDIVPWNEIPENQRGMYTYNDGSGWKGPSQEVYDFLMQDERERRKHEQMEWRDRRTQFYEDFTSTGRTPSDVFSQMRNIIKTVEEVTNQIVAEVGGAS
jgi:hypothetical protein